MPIEKKESDMYEIWRDIVGYEGLYQISSFGKVKSLGNTKNRKEKMLVLGDDDGYSIARLSKNGKTTNFKVHRLVALHFIENPQNKPEINHKGKYPNKKDNRYFMIEWATKEENERHAKRHGLYLRRAKLNKEQVLEIKESKEKAKTLCLKYNVCEGTIYYIRTNKTWRDVKPK